MPDREQENKKKSEYFRMWLKGVMATLFVLVVIFLAAGRLDYWQGWIFFGFTFVLIMIAMVLFADKTDLIKERQRPGPGTKWWDKVFWAFYGPLNLAILVIACLDSGRFGWTLSLPLWAYVSGYIIFVLSNVMHIWAMYVNRFFSSTVRIQKERGQVVVQDGPYRWIRHPGYAGGLLLGCGFALALGSLYALIPAGMVMILLVIRTVLEDRTLKEELPGYREYAERVRYRLIPGIW